MALLFLQTSLSERWSILLTDDYVNRRIKAPVSISFLSVSCVIFYSAFVRAIISLRGNFTVDVDVAHIRLRRSGTRPASLIYHNIFFGYQGGKNYKLESNRRKDPGNSLSSSGRAMINWAIFYSETQRRNLISPSLPSLFITVPNFKSFRLRRAVFRAPGDQSKAQLVHGNSWPRLLLYHLLCPLCVVYYFEDALGTSGGLRKGLRCSCK